MVAPIKNHSASILTALKQSSRVKHPPACLRCTPSSCPSFSKKNSTPSAQIIYAHSLAVECKLRACSFRPYRNRVVGKASPTLLRCAYIERQAARCTWLSNVRSCEHDYRLKALSHKKGEAAKLIDCLPFIRNYPEIPARTSQNFLPMQLEVPNSISNNQKTANPHFILYYPLSRTIARFWGRLLE